MLIIKATCKLRPEEQRRLSDDLHAQAAAGVIVLPWYCDIMGIDDNGPGIKIVQETKSKRELELEQELARAMFYISAQKDCDTCRHEILSGEDCPASCEECSGDPCRHMCQECMNGSKWEWRGLHG